MEDLKLVNVSKQNFRTKIINKNSLFERFWFWCANFFPTIDNNLIDAFVFVLVGVGSNQLHSDSALFSYRVRYKHHQHPSSPINGLISLCPFFSPGHYIRAARVKESIATLVYISMEHKTTNSSIPIFLFVSRRKTKYLSNHILF